jgi:NADPH-dependent ferric siderophore reductase
VAPRFEASRVSAARLLSSRIRNLTISSAALAGIAFEPGADVAIRFASDDGDANERRYSVWKSEAEAGAFDICVVLHALGPGSRWAERCVVGGPVEISRDRDLPIALDRSARDHLFLGDETSIASAEALIRALPTEATVLAGFEIGSMEYRWPNAELVRPEGVRWVDRVGRPGSALLSWLTSQRLPPAASTTAYVTGEAWLCAMVQAHLVRTRGICAGSVRAMPYWKQRTRPPEHH